MLREQLRAEGPSVALAVSAHCLWLHPHAPTLRYAGDMPTLDRLARDRRDRANARRPPASCQRGCVVTVGVFVSRLRNAAYSGHVRPIASPGVAPSNRSLSRPSEVAGVTAFIGALVGLSLALHGTSHPGRNRLKNPTSAVQSITEFGVAPVPLKLGLFLRAMRRDRLQLIVG